MILISHRGNTNGKIIEKENTLSYINDALNKKYYVEIDIWYENSKWFLGHDTPTTEIKFDYLNNINFFLHAKNQNALQFLNEYKHIIKAEYFWHENDSYTLTSKNNIWGYVGKPVLSNSICVLPEQQLNGNIKFCKGICSDIIDNYKNLL